MMMRRRSREVLNRISRNRQMLKRVTAEMDWRKGLA